MSEMTRLYDQYMLRVRRGSELEKAMRAMEDGPISADQMREASGMNRTPYFVRAFLSNNIDNLDISAAWGDKEGDHTMTYTDVMPNRLTLASKGVEINTTAPQVDGEISKEVQFLWPEAPPIIEEMDNFDEPSWFREMEAMVEAGRHISLQGPPSVGKDTAVEQLAARKRKPLVMVGGSRGFRERDLVGSEKITNGTSFHAVGQYAAAAINGWWALLSEVNAADPDATMYINHQLAPPHMVYFQGKAYPVHPDFRIFITYNHGLIGTKPLPQSFKDRFYSIKMGFFTEYQLLRRLQAMGMPEDTGNDEISKDQNRCGWGDKVAEYGIAMWESHERGQMRYQITTRRLIDAVMLMNMLPGTDIKDALRKAVVGAIDSPVEANEAEQVLRKVFPV